MIFVLCGLLLVAAVDAQVATACWRLLAAGRSSQNAAMPAENKLDRGV
jgi:hypothetical protein